MLVDAGAAARLEHAGLNARLCETIMAPHPYPLLFATVSGAHLYGFASRDSDYDLRGVHLLPAREVVGMKPPHETISNEGIFEGVEIDLVTHDAAKFFRMLLRNNGYVLEQLLSPLVVFTTPAHAELCELAPRCITRFHAFHYLGFAQTQWSLFAKENPPRVKPLLYVLRVLLTGIHLMRTGKLNANLAELNDEYRLAYVPDLIERKTGGAEKETIAEADMTFFAGEYERLRAMLEKEHAETKLPHEATAHEALHDLLVRLRLGEEL